MATRATLAPGKMDFFEKLGALVEQRWKDQHFDNSTFAGVALISLEEMPPCGEVDYLQIVEAAIAANRLPSQNLDSHFGEPPLTLYKSDLFYIEALFWLDAPVDIHEHGFAGAFHILEGSSLHCRYQFELKERINSRLLIGDVRLRSVECLMKGDSRAILPGRQFSHSTFHLERPTVTIVIRTLANREAGPQYSYRKPWVAYDPFAKRGLMTRQLELLKLLHAADEPDYLRQVRALLSKSDFETTFWLLEQSHRHLDPKQFAQLLERAQERYGRLAQLFPVVFQEMRRAEKINSRCRFITKPEHRLLLALLLGLPDRPSIFKFIRWNYNTDPVELISDWVEEMAATKVSNDAESSALGVRFDELSLFIFRSMLEGLSFAAIKERLKEEYNAEDVESQEQELREFFSAFQSSLLFQPLFVGDETAPLEISGRRWEPATTAERMLARAKAATRDVVFSCFLDAPPLDLIPPRTRQTIRTCADGQSIVNPTFRYEPAPDGCANDLPQESFLRGYPLVWTEDPGTEIWTAFWTLGKQATLLAEFQPAKTPPLDLEKTGETLTLANILVSPDYATTRQEEWERRCHEKRGEFQAQGYTIVRDLIYPLPLAAMRRYYRALIASGSLALGESQVDRRYSLHSEPLARFYHQQLAKLVTRIAGEPVKPSYVYFAAYQPGAVLSPHLDRPQCQFSLSFLVDYTPEPTDVSDWPLFLKKVDAPESPTAVYLGVGDGVVYKGCELLHYRDALPENHFSTSLFFHFVPKDFDGDLA